MSSESFCTHTIIVMGVNLTVASVPVQLYFSITVQQICMKIGVDITPNTGCLRLVLCLWSSFGFGVDNVFAS